MAALEQLFAELRHVHGWSTLVGNSVAHTAAIRAAIPTLIAELGVQTLIDAPCGEGVWMRTIALPGVRYIGVDIVHDLIAHNRETWGEGRTFLRLDMTREPLPDGDLILCRDCLVHFADDLVIATLRNFKASGATYLLTTTFPSRANVSIPTGGWAPLNLEAPPFSLPPPLRVINEGYTLDEGRFTDKSLGLWRLADLELVRPQSGS